MEYYVADEKKKLKFCNSMDGPGEKYTKWIKPVNKIKILHDLTYMWNLMNTVNQWNK